MNRFWDKTILPIIEKTTCKHIVEISNYLGINTKNILRYCIKNDCKLSTINPKPQFPAKQWKQLCDDTFDFYKNNSLNVLPLIRDYDIVLIDGDHNWYTVYNELKIVERYSTEKDFPIVILHDVSWPYGRRDVYDDPKNIPEEYRQPYSTDGMIRGQSKLVAGGFNCTLNNAIYEGNEKNGVLTAVEDFLSETDGKLKFRMTNKWNGLGIIYCDNKMLNDLIIKYIP